VFAIVGLGFRVIHCIHSSKSGWLLLRVQNAAVLEFDSVPHAERRAGAIILLHALSTTAPLAAGTLQKLPWLT
ncbi:MAG: hypothetical protein ACYDD1_14645, partial [Caulobacteraceae bacterium]